ncbi:MAG TPA: TRAP transporter small permease [Alphaproteobacteria bacterium]|nr:TRAP transporter small permease [Alphaproteobacteria bacterium]
MAVLKAIDGLWGRLLWLLMAIAAVYVGAIMVLIVYVTIFRAAGWSYTPFANIAIEYGFVYILFLGSPWLVRQRAHIYIEILTAAIPEGARKILSRGIVTAAAIICFIWTWYTWGLFVERWGDTMSFDELRAQFNIPLWLSTIPFPIGFFMMGVEFLRFAFTAEPMHVGIAGVASDRIELEEQQRDLARER